MIKNKVESPVIDDSWITVAIETVVKRNNVNSLNDVDRIVSNLFAWTRITPSMRKQRRYHSRIRKEGVSGSCPLGLSSVARLVFLFLIRQKCRAVQ